MRVSLPTCLFVVSVFGASSTARGEAYDGDWINTSVSFRVTVESWGANCGREPTSYGKDTRRPVVVREEGGHLVFSDGSIRTDRCGSPNPKVDTILARRAAGRWQRECETPRSDAKYEHGVYTLAAINANRLEYTAVSKFDWTLKGDHCVAEAVERRVFIRETRDLRGGAAPASDVPVENAEVGTDARTEDDICSAPGPLTRFEISPGTARIGPGEMVCFRLIANDANGCSVTPENLVWSVSQDGIGIPDLISKGGCFRAGETAAESEGRYAVTVRAGGRTAKAEIVVVFEDLGELFAARLRPLEAQTAPRSGDMDGAFDSAEAAETSTGSGDSSAAAAAQTAGPVVASPVADAREPSQRRADLAWAILFGALMAGGVVAFWYVHRLGRSSHRRDSVDLDDWLDTTSQPESQPPLFSAEPERNPGEDPQGGGEVLSCPQCGRQYSPGAKFCPHDKSRLRTLSESHRIVPEGRICPICHRGYDADARFCPHDSTQLIPYADWRVSKRPGENK